MSSLQKRKAQLATAATVRRRSKPPPGAANEVVNLLRIAVEHLAAMRAMMEAAQAAINNNDPTPPPDLIDMADLLTVQQSAGTAGRDEKTIRRWHADFKIGVMIGGTLYIQKSKLIAHIAHTKRCAE